MNKGTSKWEKAQEGRALENRCWKFLRRLLEELHGKVDRRLVKTLLDLVLVILLHRHRNNGLLLSELGDHLLGGERGPAGVKRIASLLHSVRWKSVLILNYLWQRANEKVRELRKHTEEAYVIWDESVLEKSESLQAEGLCAVRSSKAGRLKRIKPGYFNPPTGRPIFVPGFNWLQLLVTGLKGAPVLAHLCWWTTRGKKASKRRLEGGKRSWEHRRLWDTRRRCYRKTGIVACPVHLPDDDRQLFLVVSRPGYGRKPWYLITTEMIATPDQAWQIIFAYARRWQIEMSLRFTKSEMAFEAPRLQAWEARLKFLLIASLAYAFLLSLLTHTEFLYSFISRYCHRTGKWSLDISAPLYRLRLAISRLWLLFPPHSLPKLISG